ncbi:MAG: hypothetical protein ACI8PP_002716, partial [Candidatus Pseudothioglobus sp.]
RVGSLTLNKLIDLHLIAPSASLELRFYSDVTSPDDV